MAQDVLAEYTNFDGFVILHGTDTMAYTASAFSFLFTSLKPDGFPQAVLSKPIVFSGSQLPLLHEDADGQLSLLFNTDAVQNICGAIAAAQMGIPEVCLYFNDTLFRGNRTVKTNADEFHAFSSPNYPSLGAFGIAFNLENDHILHLPTTHDISLDAESARDLLKDQLDYLATNIDSSTVIPFRAFPAHFSSAAGTSVLSDMLTSYIKHTNIDGIVLEAYGEGNFPSGNPEQPEQGGVYRTLKTAHEQGIVIIDCTQVLDGIVDSNIYAAGSWLVDVGVVGAYDMTSITALTKLIYLHTLRNYRNNNWQPRTIARLMQTNITGEIMDVHRLDSRGKWYLGAGESIEALDGSVALVNEVSSGPVLRNRSGAVLWRAIPPKSESMPGRLYMQGDGDLVFYDNSNTKVWASHTAGSLPAASMLILEGESDSSGIRLYIYNYAKGEVSSVLYS